MSTLPRTVELKRRLFRSAVKFRRFPLAQRTAHIACAAVGGFDNRGNWRMAENGQVTLARRLAPFGPEMVFDVGANVGDWTAMMHHACPEALIRSFEPVPSTAAGLRRLAQPLGTRVVTHELALGDQSGLRKVCLDVSKIETEGADHLVLAGFEGMLAARLIDVTGPTSPTWSPA